MLASRRTSADPQAGEPTAGGDGLSILVVDDDDLVRVGAARSLARLGYSAPSVSRPQEALDMLRAGHSGINLLFSDIRMPGDIDGFELARIVSREFPHIAILLTTGFAGRRPKDVEAKILYKPYKLADLAAAVRESLETHGRNA
jgi:CheY-like chemotaxis protein